jgi:hypothetical protein
MPKSDGSSEASQPRAHTEDAPAAAGDCPHMDGCKMFGLFSLAGALATWKTNYCSAEFRRCERYQRALQGRVVPNNLMPNGALLRKWTPTK